MAFLGGEKEVELDGAGSGLGRGEKMAAAIVPCVPSLARQPHTGCLVQSQGDSLPLQGKGTKAPLLQVDLWQLMSIGFSGSYFNSARALGIQKHRTELPM